jgi:hypothetical protein
MISNEYVRDGKGQILGRVSRESQTGNSTVRDSGGKILGRTNGTETRDSHGNIVSRGSHPDLLINKR